MGGRRCAIATLCAALASSSGCLSDLTKPPGLDGGGEGEDGGGGEPDAGGGGPRCDPALPFGEPVLLTTAPSSINTTWEDGWPRVSRDDLTLYWVRAQERDGGRFLGGNLFFVTRDAPDTLFDSETSMYEQEFSSDANNDAPFLSPDATELYYSNAVDHIFVSDRGAGGGLFPYPGELVNFGTEGVRDMHPYLVGDDRMYFTSSRSGSPDVLRVYSSTRSGADWNSPTSLNIGPDIQQIAPVVSSDHRVLFFSADGTLYRAVRGGGGTFETALPADDLNEGISYPGSLSRDDCILYFHSDRSGGDFDIWIAQATVIDD